MMLGWKHKFSGCTAHAASEGPQWSLPLQAQGLRYRKSVPSLHLLLVYKLLSDVTAISWFCFWSMVGSLVPSDFQLEYETTAHCQESWCSLVSKFVLALLTVRHLFIFCVEFYGVCTKWESYNNEIHSITFIKKQITLVCVPGVFEFIDRILFQYSSVQHFQK